MWTTRLKMIFSDNSSFSLVERIVVLLFFSFLFVLAKFALRAPEERWPGNRTKENCKMCQIIVLIYGAVEDEGRYHFKDGDTLKVALEAVSLKQEADIRGIDLRQRLKPGQRIKIKKSQ